MDKLQRTKLKTELEGLEKIVKKFIEIAEEYNSKISNALEEINDQESEESEVEYRKIFNNN